MSLLKRIGGTEGVNQTPYIPPTPAPPACLASSSAPTPPRRSARPIRLRSPPVGVARRKKNWSGATPAAPQKDGYMDLKERVQARLIAELDPKMDLTKIDEVRRQVEEIFNNILETRATSS